MMRTTGSLDEPVGIVTGASTGIGRAIAMALAEDGVQVGLAARSTSKLESLADAIETAGGAALAVPADVTDRAQVASVIEQTRETFGGLDLLVNNAGVGHWERRGIVDGDLDEWDREIEVNLQGVMYGTHLAADVMRDDGGGDIVTVGSLGGRYPAAEWPSYVASKYGVRGFTESARLALREAGIRVTLVEPGEVTTPMQPEEGVESTPMLDPGDVADAVVYAVSRPDHVCINDLQIVHSGRGDAK